MPYATERNEKSFANTNANRKNVATAIAKRPDDDEMMIEVPRLEKTGMRETLAAKLRCMTPSEPDGGLRNFAGAPHPDLIKLRLLEGSWNITGTNAQKDSGCITGSETFEWMEGAFFLIRKWDTKQNGIRSTGMSIIGHCPFTNTFYATTYDNTGYKRHYKLFVTGMVFTFEGERERIVLTITDDGKSYIENREISLNKKWMPLCGVQGTTTILIPNL